MNSAIDLIFAGADGTFWGLVPLMREARKVCEGRAEESESEKKEPALVRYDPKAKTW